MRATHRPRIPNKVEAFLARALEASDGSATVAGALVPSICDALLSNHSVKAYGREFMDFVRQMQAQGVTALEATADHVKMAEQTRRRYTFFQETSVQGLTDIYPVRFFTRILTDVQLIENRVTAVVYV